VRLSILFLVLAMLLLVSSARGQIIFRTVSPAVQPDPPPANVQLPIVEVQLEDPVTPQSKTYLDFDTGKTFARSDGSSLDYLASRQWVREHGVDLMCESRDPANGLISYDTVVRKSDSPIDKPPIYSALKRIFDRAEAQPFDMITPGAELPRTYLFKTSDGAMGVFEICAVTENPSGLKMRYRIVPEPPKPSLVRRQVIIQPPRMAAMRVAQQEKRLAELRPKFGELHPVVKKAERDLAMYKEMADVEKKETDPQLMALKTSKISLQYSLKTLQDRYPDDSVQIKAAQSRIDIMQKRIDQAETLRNGGTNTTRAFPAPATQPVKVSPVTQPSSQDFHL
jgi:hypothetical protein